MRRGKHKDVEFEVDAGGKRLGGFKSFDEAAAIAVAHAASTGRVVELDVIVFSSDGAYWWSGDRGVEEYIDDPEASVFDRIEIEANAVGRIP